MKQPSVQQYRRVMIPFLAWVATLSLEPEFGYEYDDLLVEYRWGADGAVPPSKSAFEKLVACIERLLPDFKGELLLAGSELNSRAVVFATRHTTPLLWIWTVLLARRLVWWGLHRAAALLLLQRRRGLRPSEALGLQGGGHLLMPSSNVAGGEAGALLLGVKAGTKSKRPQSVRFDADLDVELAGMFKGCTAPNEQLTHIRALGGYALLLDRAAIAEGLADAHFTCHSPRAGYVTEEYLRHGDIPRIMGVTRHVSVRSMRLYVDIQSVAVGQLAARLAQLLPRAIQANDEILPMLHHAFAVDFQERARAHSAAAR